MSRKTLILWSACVLFYAMGYAVARNAKWIVHSTGFSRDSGGVLRLRTHRVVQGDFGTPMLSPLVSTIQAGIYFLYAPASWAETQLWKLRKPVGTPFTW